MKASLKGMLAVGVLAASTIAVLAAGNYSTYPIVGGASFCVSTVGVNGQAGITGQGGGAAGTNGAYCAQTVPAGPPIVTGSELIPADTGLGGGAPPQTVVLTLASLNALPPAYPQFGNGTATNTFTVSPLVGVVVLSSATGLLSSTTMTFPAAPIDGQQLAVSSTGTITSFAVSANVGQSSLDNPTIITASTTGSYGYRWIFRAATAQWLRLQ